jgi:hypothetical protein
MKVKTIDINAKEWFDKVNGNSYFSGVVTVNYGLKDCKEFKLPFQYGYGDSYIDNAFVLLAKEKIINLNRGYYSACIDKKIILRSNITRNCKKRSYKIMDYLKQAQDFLDKTDTKMIVKYLKFDKYFADDKECRDIYKITLIRNDKSYSFTFGQSIINSGEVVKQDKRFPNYRYMDKISRQGPTAYDVLACLEKYPQENFKDFCANFGYDNDSIKAYKIYKAVKEQYNNLARMFTQKELEQMAEIQ